ncbi:complex I NDUFA9 subunit family protein [Sphingomonas ginkgonis]|uniref:Complex I NDUFA9 subunit family protein n=2 Tax=Sphingomonas ginkgonis TaxID=2315330 RepID=A0A429VE39_9SPHN|nr:complex I NDUFA9 subunit family protein [Sphingomonas ginkgonis]
MLDPRTQIVTVIGGGGFLGRYVCERLFKAGVRVRVAQRHPRAAWFLQPLAAVGQLALVKADVGRPATLERAIDGASSVIYLPGLLKGDMERVHVDGPRAAAEFAAKNGAKSFVHVSAIGASKDSPSRYGQSKARGEAAVKAAFPGATIIRPSLVFGPEDQLTNRFAAMAQLPVLPIIAPNTKFQPIYSRDAGPAIALAALEPERYAGETIELGGPEIMTMRELVTTVARLSGSERQVSDLPDMAADLLSRFGFLPGAPLNRDQWAMLQQDNVASADGGLAAFGIIPTPLEAVGRQWLSRFKEGGRFRGLHQPTEANVTRPAG